MSFASNISLNGSVPKYFYLRGKGVRPYPEFDDEMIEFTLRLPRLYLKNLTCMITCAIVAPDLTVRLFFINKKKIRESFRKKIHLL